MRKKTLIETNPYLKDPVMREKLIARSVRTSCGVEGIRPEENDEFSHLKITHRKDKKIYKMIAENKNENQQLNNKEEN